MKQKNYLPQQSRLNGIKRRDFLKQSIPICVGISIGTICLSCKRNRSSSQKDNAEAEDFLMIAYCGLDCERCDAYLATLNKDENLKTEVAERWGMKPEDIFCMGCKSENALFSCSAKKCAVERNVITCAHCEDFITCDNEIWEKYPQIRQKAEELRKQLEEQQS
jgi:hypothetical protein